MKKKLKDYKEMTPAEQGVMDYLQAYSYYRVNSKTVEGQEVTDTERVLHEIAKLGGLID